MPCMPCTCRARAVDVHARVVHIRSSWSCTCTCAVVQGALRTRRLGRLQPYALGAAALCVRVGGAHVTPWKVRLALI